MNRTDAHLHAMLRHLGAAYYDYSLHGRAAQADVARALAAVRVAARAGRPHRAPAPDRRGADDLPGRDDIAGRDDRDSV
jgi:hypothetical protein